MNNSNRSTRGASLGFACLMTMGLFAVEAAAQAPVTNDPPHYGPFDAVFLADGEGLKKPLLEHESVLQADSSWSLYFWLRPAEELNSPTLLAGVGNPLEKYPRYIGLDGGKLLRWLGKDNNFTSSSVVTPGKWHFLTATFDGVEFRLYIEGAEVATGKLALLNASDSSRILPAYFTDSYLSLLPGESREIDIEYPAAAASGALQLTLRGWNLSSQTISVTLQK